MKRETIIYRVEAEVHFTEEEVDLLIQCSKAHYDLTCRLLSSPTTEPGDRTLGMLTSLKRMFDHGPKGEPRPKTVFRDLSSRDLNLLCKVVEMHPIAAQVGKQLHEIFDELKAEYRRLNP